MTIRVNLTQHPGQERRREGGGGGGDSCSQQVLIYAISQARGTQASFQVIGLNI